MSKLRPVKSPYTPKYPRRLSEAELQRYLRPGLRRRFSNETMILSTLLMGSALTSCAQGGSVSQKEASPVSKSGKVAPVSHEMPGGRKPLPMMGKSTRTDPNLKEKVDQLVAEVLGSQQGGRFHEHSRVNHYRLIADNPMIKMPSVYVMFGNSIMGIFNVEEAKLATMRLFEAYGIPLDADVAVQGAGYQFLADGHNDELGVGFEIRTGGDQSFGWDAQSAEASAGDEYLGDTELLALEKEVNSDKIDMFVCNPNIIYDGDHKMAMSYYLASVVDYLNWIHGDRTVELTKVLGESRERAVRRTPKAADGYVIWVPGASESETLGAWTVDRGDLSVYGEGVRIELEPGATLNCRPPDVSSVISAWNYIRISMSVLRPEFEHVDLDFHFNDDARTRQRHTFMSNRRREIDIMSDSEIGPDPRKVPSISITNVNKYPISIEVARLEAHRY